MKKSDLKAYIVGGWVRDTAIARILGRPESPNDRDWVVIGETSESMLGRGFKCVGKDFPVFLHPQTKEEYALARTETKNGHGYKGFSVKTDRVSLEEDLLRRDLTINAIAFDGQNFIDPYGGLEDIRKKILRHTSEAFAEDPVRILRLARFAARLADFTVAPETEQFVRSMIEQGEADYLTAERVYAEFEKAFSRGNAKTFLGLLDSWGFFRRCLPRFPGLLTAGFPARVDGVAENFALLTSRLGSEAELNAFYTHLHAPAGIASFARKYVRLKPLVTRKTDSETLLQAFTAGEALRQGEAFAQLIRLLEHTEGIRADFWLRALDRYRRVNPAALVEEWAGNPALPEKIREFRLQKLEDILHELDGV